MPPFCCCSPVRFCSALVAVLVAHWGNQNQIKLQVLALVLHWAWVADMLPLNSDAKEGGAYLLADDEEVLIEDVGGLCCHFKIILKGV